MPSRRIYWDANCFLSYINGEADRLPMLDALFGEARRGEIVIVTSMVSLTEVAYEASEKESRRLSQSVEASPDALFDDRSVVRVVEYHQFVARDARRLVRQALAEGWRLQPMDAIHLAAALDARAEEVHTYEGQSRRSRWAGLIGIPVHEPSGANLQLDLD